jgi:4-alpha-glucanotransferase
VLLDDDAIRAAAEQAGIQQEFHDIFGHPRVTSTATNRAILATLELARKHIATAPQLLPPVVVADEGSALSIPAQDFRGTSLAGVVVLESGEQRSFEAPVKRGAFRLDLTELPLGYHEVHAENCRMRLIVTPRCAHRPLRARSAGLGVMLHGLRSRRNWGVGDFRDLRDLIDWAVPALGVDFIALNPLHAIQNRTPFNTSPYLPNSIFFRNFLYLDVEGVPGYEKVRGDFETPEVRAEQERLRASEFVDYEAAAALKRRALERIFAVNPPNAACRNWIAEQGELLRSFTTFCALDEYLHRLNSSLWIWPDWPAEFQDPHSAAVQLFVREHEREILFHCWVQWQVDRQLETTQRHAREAGMGIGLYHDLALATDRCGSDLWAHRDFFVAGARVGSPPDGFSPSGQDWSFPPPNQFRNWDDGYRLFSQFLRSSMRHGGALRIDHVMRLFRLYWIPEGSPAADGAYVRDRPEDLVRILALESVRNGAVIIGEDLGTVEDQVRETLARFGVLSYRLLIFEQDAHGFRPPIEYPQQALVSTSTHDLPTITGYWTGEDIEARLRTSTVSEAEAQAQRFDRVRDKQRLLDALRGLDLLPAGFEKDAAKLPELTPEVHRAILGFLAVTPSAMWLINQEDMTCEPLQQNLPGTTAEYPNWQRKMRWSLEELRTLPEASERGRMIREWVEHSARA